MTGALRDRAGHRVHQTVWTDLRMDPGYVEVRRTRRAQYEVITTWLGTEPHVYETHVIRRRDNFTMTTETHGTEVEALDGNRRLARSIRISQAIESGLLVGAALALAVIVWVATYLTAA